MESIFRLIVVIAVLGLSPNFFTTLVIKLDDFPIERIISHFL